MFNLSEQVYAGESGSYVAYETKPSSGQWAVARLGFWGFLAPGVLSPEGNRQAENLIRSMQPSGMSVKQVWNRASRTMDAVISGDADRGASVTIPLAEIAGQYLEMLADNYNNEQTAKGVLYRLKIKDESGNPGQWVKGIE